MKQMVFLGAGASVEAGIPTALDLTKRISDQFRDEPSTEDIGRVVSFVIGGLLFEKARNGSDPLDARLNVESLFNAVQLLADRNSLEVSPFVGSWHPMIEEFDRVQPYYFDTRLGSAIYRLVAEEIRNALSYASLPSFGKADIDRALHDTISSAVASATRSQGYSRGYGGGVSDAIEKYVRDVSKNWGDRLGSASPHTNELDRELKEFIDRQKMAPGGGEIFSRTNESMIRALIHFVRVKDQSVVEYLAPIVKLAEQQHRLVVATLNYDNCIERVARDNGFPCDTGIVGWSDTGNFDFRKDGICLLKLHGSIDWVKEAKQRQPAFPLPRVVIRQATEKELANPGFRPAVIFGHRNKLTAEGPFLDLLRTFRDELDEAVVLTIVGYSFADPHINVFLTQWLYGKQERLIRIVNGPSFEREASENEFAQLLLEFGRINRGRVEVIGKYAGDGLASLFDRNAAPT